MALSQKSLKKIFRLPRSSGASPVVPNPPPGKSPHVDWDAVASSFMFEHYNAPDEERPQGIFHPSNGLVPEAENCLRQIVFDLLCAPRSNQSKSAQLIKILENGTNRHKGLNELFSRMAEKRYMGVVRFEHDVPVHHHTLPLSGEMDGRVTMANGHRYVLDFKTINTKNFDKTYEISLRYKVQLNTYLGIAGEKTGYIIYENKDNQKWAGPMPNFRLDFDPQLYALTEKYCAEIMRDYVNAGKIPAYDKASCDANITFCSYKRVCELHRNMPKSRVWDWRPEETKRRHLEVLQCQR